MSTLYFLGNTPAYPLSLIGAKCACPHPLQKANGKLFPFGFYHLLKAKKESKEVLFYLIGVDPEYQSKGVTAIIFDEYYKTFTEKGIKDCIRTPELEDNIAIHQLWKHFDPVTYRRRRTYRIDL